MTRFIYSNDAHDQLEKQGIYLMQFYFSMETI